MRFSPGIYEHAAALLGRRPYEVSRDGELLFKAHHRAWETYHHPMIVAGIDVYNLEPEAYGAAIDNPEGNNIPAIARHPCGEIEELPDLAPLDPLADAGIREVLKAGQALAEACTDAEVRIPVCGPFALAAGLLGINDLLMALVEDPGTVIRALDHLRTGQVRFLEAIRKAGLRPLFFESGTTPPLLSPKQFREIAAPALRKLLGASDRIFCEAAPCIIGGDAAPIAETFLETGPGWVIAPSETDQEAFMKTAMDFPGTHVRVNMPSSCLLESAQGKIFHAAQKAATLAHLRPNTSVGCGVVPFEAAPETVLLLRDFFDSTD